jgi:hypothetical protein
MGISGGPDIIQDGLVLALDAADKNSYPGSGTAWYDISGNNNHFTLYNGVAYSISNGGSLSFDGTNDYAASTNNLNLSSYDYIVVDVFFKSNIITGGMVFEHTANWNSNAGGFGLYINSNGSANQYELHHTNHNTEGARNYVLSGSLNWNNHVNVYSKVSDSTGRLTYGNSSLLPFSSIGGYPITTTTTAGGSFPNALFYIATRAGSGGFFNGNISSLKIYGFKINQFQVLQNYNSQKSRFNL